MENQKGNFVTKIEVQKNNKERVNVFVDGEYLFSCDAEIVYSNGLKAGKQADTDYLLKVINEDNFLRCKNHALKIIEKVCKTEKETYNKLLLKGYDNQTVERVINFLKEYEFLNDNTYTNRYVAEKSKTQGKSKIKYELLKKGINEETVKEVLSNLEEEKQMEAIISLANKKLGILIKSEQDNRKLYKKLGDFLIRRGYSFEEVKRVLSIVLEKDYSEE